MKTFLDRVYVKNYLSLRDVTLPLKPLTVIVGPTASGKSNVLESLNLLNWMVVDKPSPSGSIRGFFWAGEASRITFQSQTNVPDTPTELGLILEVQSVPTEYKLAFHAGAEQPFVAEALSVNGVKVISIQNGQGVVQDEDGTNQTKYRSSQLALESAGDYGDKPVTSALTKFIKRWKFYDFQTESIRPYFESSNQIQLDKLKELRQVPGIGDNGSTLSASLSYWHENDPERFGKVSESLATSTNLRIDRCAIVGRTPLCLVERDKKPIPLIRASNGTVQLIAYYTLLNQPDLPPLIAIEEPERNLHPGVLTDIANVLEQLAERSQVIITTHSSQLLDAFNPEILSDTLGVLLLRNRPGIGTEVINIEEICQNRAALEGWITDFGIGSAIFESELLQDLME
ncbi:MAG: AAA family ATPase [Candidatus Poribacteria bacterium]|nr:AAA family ATPase [Candidatus Poribacteria bacterium]